MLHVSIQWNHFVIKDSLLCMNLEHLIMICVLCRAIYNNVTYMHDSAGSILDISKNCDTCERTITIRHGIAIIRYIEYRTNVR